MQYREYNSSYFFILLFYLVLYDLSLFYAEIFLFSAP